MGHVKWGSALVLCTLSLGASAAAAPPSGSLFTTQSTKVFTANRPYGIRFDDFDGDGVRDYLVNELDKLTLYFMTASRTTRTYVSYTGEQVPINAPIEQLYLQHVNANWVDSGDLTGDGVPEVLMTEDAGIRVLQVTTSGFHMLTRATNGDYQGAAIGHFTSGAAANLVVVPVQRTDPLELRIMTLSGGTLVQTQSLGGAGFTGKSTSASLGTDLIADLNGDGTDDLVYAGTQSALLRQSGGGGLGAAAELALGAGPEMMAAGDFDGDKKKDLAICAGGAVHTFLQTSAGGFAESGAPLQSACPRKAIAVDLDGDGREELVGDSVLWRDNDNWVKGEALSLGRGYLQSVEDWDGDGLLDVVVLDTTTDSSVSEGDLSVLRGQQEKLSVKLVSNTAAVAGEQFEAVFEIKNAGPSDSGPVTVTVSSADSSFPAISAPSSCSTSPCTLGSLGPGQTTRVTVHSTPASNDTETVSVSVRGTTWEVDLSDNQASAMSSVAPRTDLSGEASLLVKDATIHIPISMGNAGPSKTARGVHLVVTLPPEISMMTWQSRPDASCSASPPGLVCDLNELIGSWSIDIQGGFSYHNQQVAMSGELSSQTIDPDPSNNRFGQVLPENFLRDLGGPGALKGPTASSDSGGCGCSLPHDGRGTNTFVMFAFICGLGIAERRLRRRRRGPTAVAATDTLDVPSPLEPIHVRRGRGDGVHLA